MENSGVRRNPSDILACKDQRTGATDELSLAAIFESSTEAIIGKDLEGKITAWNPAAEILFGYTAEEARGLSPAALLPPDRADEEHFFFKLLQSGENVRRFDTVRVRKNGQLLDVSLAISPVKDPAGQVVGFVLMAHDITERRLRSVRLQRFKELYHNAISGMGGVPYLYDLTTKSYGLMDEGIQELTGYSLHEMSPALWRKITRQYVMLGEAEGLTMEEATRRAHAGEIRCWRCDNLIITKQGEERWISDTSVPHYDENHEIIAFIGILQDITRRKQAEQALRQSEERFRCIVESNMIGIFFWRKDGSILDANEKFLSMVNYTREEVMGGMLFWDKMTPLEHRALDEKKLEELRVHGFCQPYEKEFFRRDGSRCPILIGGATMPGAPHEGICYVLDVSERRRVEEHLATFSFLSQELSAATTPREAASIIARIARDLFGWDAFSIDAYSDEDGTVQPLLSMDTIDGRRVEVAAKEFTKPPSGASRRAMNLGAELVLKQEPVLMLPDEGAFGDTSRPSASIMRVPIRHHDRTIGVMSVHSYKVNAYTHADLATVQSFADHCAGALERMRIKEKMSLLQTQLINAARRTGMEEVATDVLHNIGNVLNSINVSATLVMQNVGKSEMNGLQELCNLLHAQEQNLASFLTSDPRGRRVPDYLQSLAQYWSWEQASMLKELESLNKNITHIKAIITRQQAFAGASGFVESVMISELLEDALTLGGFNLDRIGTTITREYTLHFPIVVDRIKLMLILVNLVSNARDALVAAPQPRVLTLRTAAHAYDRVQIIVADNGVGIAPENLQRIFSHGFTTKKMGHGFGLHGSVMAAREMGGSLSAHSDGPGCGAVFTLELPLKTAEKA